MELKPICPTALYFETPSALKGTLFCEHALWYHKVTYVTKLTSLI